MRPDEMAAEREIERQRSTDKVLKKGANLAIGAGTAALGLGAASKVLPFLNEYIPMDLAIKGINKVSPEIGRFLKKGQSMGLDMKEGMDFIKSKIQPKEQEKESQKIHPLQEFETNYPQLAQGLMNTIQNGQTPQAAAAILKQSSVLGKQVKKLEKEVGKNFVDYVLELFGPQSGGMQPQQRPQPLSQGQENATQQGQGGLDQSIMAALDKILKM